VATDEIDGIEIDLALLPSVLRTLAPLVREFAVGDDLVRNERMEAASSETSRRFRGFHATRANGRD